MGMLRCRRPHEAVRRERMEKLERQMREMNRGKVQGRRWLKKQREDQHP